MSLMFFTPTEELHGSNIFSRVSNNYNIIQPYLEIIDKEFIQFMNMKVYNIALIVKTAGETNNYMGNEINDSKE